MVQYSGVRTSCTISLLMLSFRDTRKIGVFDVGERGPMSYTTLLETFAKLAARAIKSSRLVALAMAAAFTLVAMQPAQAQSADTWKSVAIIGGSTAAGAYI